MDDGPWQVGTVTTVVPALGFAFVWHACGDVFLHCNEVVAPAAWPLAVGARVRYRLRTGPKGRCGTDVVVVDDTAAVAGAVAESLAPDPRAAALQPPQAVSALQPAGGEEDDGADTVVALASATDATATASSPTRTQPQPKPVLPLFA